MNRRNFLKRSGLTAALASTGGTLAATAPEHGTHGRTKALPRPDDWVEDERFAAWNYLNDGRVSSFLTGYNQPQVRFGWNFIDTFPLLLIPGKSGIRGSACTLAIWDRFTYAYSEHQSLVGHIRVDYLSSQYDIGGYDTKLYRVELDGQHIGSAGELNNDNSKNLYSNWYGGIRHKDYAFRIKDGNGFGPETCTHARMEIWERLGAGAQDSAASRTC